MTARPISHSACVKRHPIAEYASSRYSSTLSAAPLCGNSAIMKNAVINSLRYCACRELLVRLFLLPLIWILLISYPAFAQNSDKGCIGYTVSDDPRAVSLYEVDATSPAHFIHGDEILNCPGPDKACEAPAYLVNGDQVIVTRTLGGYACSTFVGIHKGRLIPTRGWLQLSSLREISIPFDWHGNWSTADRNANINISVKSDGMLALSGDADWSSALTTNVGDFNVITRGKTNSISFGIDPSQADGSNTIPYDVADKKSWCAIRMAQLGRYLVVSDNGGCGGINVTFSGVYIKPH
jgi:hypothetical protein